MRNVVLVNTANIVSVARGELVARCTEKYYAAQSDNLL